MQATCDNLLYCLFLLATWAASLTDNLCFYKCCVTFCTGPEVQSWGTRINFFWIWAVMESFCPLFCGMVAVLLGGTSDGVCPSSSSTVHTPPFWCIDSSNIIISDDSYPSLRDEDINCKQSFICKVHNSNQIVMCEYMHCNMMWKFICNTSQEDFAVRMGGGTCSVLRRSCLCFFGGWGGAAGGISNWWEWVVICKGEGLACGSVVV